MSVIPCSIILLRYLLCFEVNLDKLTLYPPKIMKDLFLKKFSKIMGKEMCASLQLRARTGDGEVFEVF